MLVSACRSSLSEGHELSKCFSSNTRGWKEIRTCIISEGSFVEPCQCSAKQRAGLEKFIPAGNFVIRWKTRD